MSSDEPGVGAHVDAPAGGDGGLEVAHERAAAVGSWQLELERQGHHVGAVAATVGHERDGAGHDELREVSRQRGGRCGR